MGRCKEEMLMEGSRRNNMSDNVFSCISWMVTWKRFQGHSSPILNEIQSVIREVR